MTTAIIQARMGSTRLPDKTLMDIEGKPLLWHLIERVKRTKTVDEIVIATTENPRDARIVDFARDHGVRVFRGSENDVLDRFYRVAKKVKADTVVRVTPDCPMISPRVIDKVVREYLKGGHSYVTNTLQLTYPDGYDVEVFSFRALEKAWKECKDPADREHVTPYMRNSGRFTTLNVLSEDPVDPSKYKWSVDRPEDLEFVRNVFSHLYKKRRFFTYKDIKSLLSKKPDIRRNSSGIIPNEGYYKSILKASSIKPRKIKIDKSISMKKKVERLIPGCSQTFSKAPSQFVQGVAPVFLESGKGSRVWDVDGNSYIDYAMALGPVILGHSYPAVNEAVKKALKKGSTFSMPHKMECELAELLSDVIPCAEMVRFGKNGSDATSGAVRVARAYTGRDMIACCGYHGWQDWYIATTTRNKGIPKEVGKLTLTFEYNRPETLERLFAENRGRIACVIMEPVGVTEPEGDFLDKVRELTHKNGALLIYDEIVTGFRMAPGGAQEYYGVKPDIACFGKAMANGFPVSAVTGKKEIMRLFDEIFYSFTFAGEIISIAAALATIKEIRKKNVIRHIWEQGRRLRDGYNVFTGEYSLEKRTRCVGLNPRTVTLFYDKKGETDLSLKSLFQQECLKRGILFSGCHNVCYSHSNEDIEYTLRAYNTVFEIIKDAVAKDKVKKMLKGEPVQPVFRKA